jgi:hypothetical protein
MTARASPPAHGRQRRPSADASCQLSDLPLLLLGGAGAALIGWIVAVLLLGAHRVDH